MTPTANATSPARWALVTGASGRGGAAIARALHARGVAVVLHHTPRSLDAAAAVQRELEAARPASTRLWQADFTAPTFGLPTWLLELGIRLLVCNASAYQPSSVGDLTRLAADLAVHLGANARILEALRPSLESVVAITDIAVDRAPPGHLTYTTAKGALQTLVLALANDWAPDVRCNVVQPGTLPFPPDWHDQHRMQRILESIPLGRIGTFEDLAGAVVYLGLDAGYVTGQVLAVDGGRSRQAH